MTTEPCSATNSRGFPVALNTNAMSSLPCPTPEEYVEGEKVRGPTEANGTSAQNSVLIYLGINHRPSRGWEFEERISEQRNGAQARQKRGGRKMNGKQNTAGATSTEKNKYGWF